MSLLFSNKILFEKPPITGESSGNMGLEDTIEFLGAEDEPEVLELPKSKTPKTDDKETETSREDEGETPETEEKDELEEIEKELEPPTEEQLELVTPVRRKEILAKYPNLFKDFPYLERAYYRDQQFTEILPTIDDAKTAVAKAETLDRFETDILGGSTENILRAVKEEDKNAFYKIVDDYLPTLAKVDEQAYYHVLGNITKHTIVAMIREARSSKNEVLESAATILNQFVFGSSDFKPPTNLSKDTPDKQEESRVNEREQTFLRQQFETVSSDLDTRVNNALKSTIDAYIDPKKSMSDYVRKTASKEALESLNDLIDKDTRFKTLADKLWERAFETNFSKESVDRIRSAYLSKAKTLLPSVIKKARNEALRGTGKRVSSDEEESTPNRGPVPAGKPRSQTPGKITKPQDIPKKMSTLEFLNSD